MINSIIFEDEITLWWDKEWDLDDNVYYKVTLNGDTVVTKKTYASFKELTPATAYAVKVTRVEPAAVLLDTTITTPAAKRRIDVTAAPYFAVGDGKTMNTEALARAIADCDADACVYFPKGEFLTGALDLHSDMEIYIEEGATLQGSPCHEDYLPKRKSRFEGIEMECYASLLNIGELDHTAGPNCKNVVIRGKGAIMGGGKQLCDEITESERARLADFLAANEEYVKTCENNNTIPARARGRLINISNGENVIIAGLKLGYGASWNVHFIYSKNIVTYGCHICSRGVWNGDGWDPDSCDNSVLFNTTFDTHDNSIAIKSGKNPEGNIIGRPTRGVRIFDCSGAECMAVGSEMSGGVEDVYVWDCDFTSGSAGIGLKVTPKRGGYIRNVRVRNSRFVNLRARSVTFNDDGEPSGEMSVVENVLFENTTFTGISCRNGNTAPTELMLVDGLAGEDNYFRNFTFRNLSVPSDTDLRKMNIRNVQNLTIENLSFFEE